MTAVTDRTHSRVVLHVGEQYRGTEKFVVENALRSRPGVIEIEANPAGQTATVTYDPSVTSVEELRRVVEDSGFECAGCNVPGCICDPQQEPSVPQPALDPAAVARADEPAGHGEGGHSGHSMAGMAEQMRNRFFVSLGFTLAILAWSDVGKSVFSSHLATPFGLDRNVWLLLLSLPVLWAARMFFTGAVDALRQRTLDMNVLVAVTIGISLRDLAQRKLPEVDALIERAQAMRRWLTTASGCNCETLDVCALFEPTAAKPDEASPSSLELQISHVGS